ncbi:MAG TPA: nucleotidyltransferase family protein [Bacteroidaceae bacterium]|nr:nucleotidyltransferase family protein [Bacteroidaceae bacterium]
MWYSSGALIKTSMKELENIYVIILKLSSLAINNKSSDRELSDSLAALNEKEWTALYNCLSKLGVSLLVLPIVLEKNRNDIPKNIMHQWVYRYQAYESTYNNRAKLIVSLCTFLREYHFNPILMKGMSIGLDYPRPNERECGDIDLYFGDDRARFDEFMTLRGFITEDTTGKHSHITAYGEIIENHSSFLDLDTGDKQNLILERYIKKLLKKEGTYTDERLVGVNQLSYNAEALFFHRHAAVHFAGKGITLRYMCDWTARINKHWEKMNFDVLIDMWQKSGQIYYVACFHELCVRYMGVDPLLVEFPEYSRPSEKLIRKMLLEMLSPIYSKNLSLKGLKGLINKTEILIRQPWKHRLVYRRPYFKVFFKLLAKNLITKED